MILRVELRSTSTLETEPSPLSQKQTCLLHTTGLLAQVSGRIGGTSGTEGCSIWFPVAPSVLVKKLQREESLLSRPNMTAFSKCIRYSTTSPRGSLSGMWTLLNNNPAVSQTVPGDMALQLLSPSTPGTETGVQSTTIAAHGFLC